MKSEIQIDRQLPAEEEVIQKARKDPREFAVLYEKYFRSIYLFTLHRVGEKELAADLTSQVFLKALQKLDRYEARGFPFSSWLYRIAVNECNDFFRRSKRQRVVVLDDSHAEILYEELFGNDRLEELKAKLPYILERLSPDEIQVIELRFMESRSFREVGEVLGITETYAKVKTYRILEKMKKLFKRK